MITKDRLELIADLWQTLHDNWAKNHQFDYVVLPSKDIEMTARPNAAIN